MSEFRSRSEGAVSRLADSAGAHPLSHPIAHPIEAVKPRLRGWLHAGISPVVLAAGIVLVCLAPTPAIRWAAGVYSLAGVALFASSAVYNIGDWQARGQAILKRLDHGNIYLIMAGTYTPIAILTLEGAKQEAFLAGAWIAAGVGVVFRVWWLHAPRGLYTGLYIALGWAVVPFMGDVFATSTAAGILILIGGVLYTTGAGVYGFQRPNPHPTWFGFHELFHAFTIGAWICQYVAVSILTYQAQP